MTALVLETTMEELGQTLIYDPGAQFVVAKLLIVAGMIYHALTE